MSAIRGKQLKSDRQIKSGYRFTTIGGRRLSVHRLLMERKLGRKLNTSEYVHHKNENGLDNRLSNLKLLSVQRHSSLHRSKYPKVKRCQVCARFFAPHRSYRRKAKTCGRRECYLAIQSKHPRTKVCVVCGTEFDCIPPTHYRHQRTCGRKCGAYLNNKGRTLLSSLQMKSIEESRQRGEAVDKLLRRHKISRTHYYRLRRQMRAELAAAAAAFDKGGK